MMFNTNTTYIGIDPTAGQRPFSYAALDSELRLLALGQTELEGALAFAAGQRQSVVAVSAPRQPNQGLMDQEELRRSLNPIPRPGRWQNFRLCEYQLRQHRISSPQTPRQETGSPRWMRMSFNLYRRLEALGYLPEDQPGDRHVIEVYPHACYTVLLGQAPFPKHTLEGRLQRQLLLYERKVNLHDPMRFFEEVTRHRLLHGILPDEGLYTAGELDAIVAAYTAWLASTQPDQVVRLGDRSEGEIVLPTPALKSKY